MTGRLILAIISSILEEVAIVAIVLWGLPKAGINIPVWGLILIMICWGTYSITTFRLGTKALKRAPIALLPHMEGSKGTVISELAPEGMVKIKNELWIARMDNGTAKLGEKITVLKRNGLKLVVSAGDITGNEEGKRG